MGAPFPVECHLMEGGRSDFHYVVDEPSLNAVLTKAWPHDEKCGANGTGDLHLRSLLQVCQRLRRGPGSTCGHADRYKLDVNALHADLSFGMTLWCYAAVGACAVRLNAQQAKKGQL
jgi:hypothetical protein